MKDCLFLERISNESAISCLDGAVLSYFVSTSNTCVVHTECYLASASYCRPRPHYIKHSKIVIPNPRISRLSNLYTKTQCSLKSLQSLHECGLRVCDIIAGVL